MIVQCNGNCKRRSCVHAYLHEYGIGCSDGKCRVLKIRVKCVKARRKAK